MKKECESDESNVVEAILKIKHDIDVNKRCLQEESYDYVKRILGLWLKFDEELLEILGGVNDSKRT